MNTQTYDTGILLVVLQRFESQRLPRLVDIKQGLDLGNTLNEFDIEFLSEALHDARNILPYIDRHPEYEVLLSKVFHYYKLIADEALNNETRR